jgi:hypothetical protein
MPANDTTTPASAPDTVSQIQSAIKAAAPRLAQALDGPDAAIALSALGRVLVGDALASNDQVLAALHTADPASIQAAEQDTLRRLQQTGDSLALATKLIDADTTTTVAAIGDTENARLMQMQSHDSTARWLAFGVSVVFGAVLLLILIGAFWCKVDVSEGVKPLLYTLLGVLATSWANIIGFYFGSSAGSMQKSQALSSALMQRTAGSSSAPGP